MSDLFIGRRSRCHSITIGTAVAESSTVQFDDAAGAVLIMGATPSSSATRIDTFASDDSVNFRRIENGRITLARLQGQECVTVTASDGTVTSSSQVCTTYYTSVAGCYVLPDAIFPTHLIRLVADAPLGDVDARVCVKS
jgi:hypothetical protein